MPTKSETTTTETVTIEKAVHLLSETCSRIADRVTIVEGQVAEIYKLITDVGLEMSSSLVKFREDSSNQIIRIQEQNQQQLEKLLNAMENFKKEAQSGQSNSPEFVPTDNDHLIPIKRISNTTNQSEYVDNNELQVSTSINSIPTSRTIVIPPSTAVPTFHGKHSERPNQFLIRVQEYAETIHGWNRAMLLHGISQFLRDTALDWYCQLRTSHRRPKIWAEFVDLFLSQFNSPIRSARQEHEWYECKQMQNETINEFLVRLRAIWTEQKPKETEVDLIRHLLCKMRTDLLSMIGVPLGASLDEIIMEAQKVEEILYRRAKAQRRTEYQKQVLLQGDISSYIKSDDGEDINQRKTHQRTKAGYPANNRTETFKETRNDTTNRWNTSNPSQYSNYNALMSTDHRQIQQLNSIKCNSCGIFGHFTKNCPNSYADMYQQREAQPYQKNEDRALRQRDNNARR